MKFFLSNRLSNETKSQTVKRKNKYQCNAKDFTCIIFIVNQIVAWKNNLKKMSQENRRYSGGRKSDTSSNYGNWCKQYWLWPVPLLKRRERVRGDEGEREESEGGDRVLAHAACRHNNVEDKNMHLKRERSCLDMRLPVWCARTYMS